eukprot:CAMPEP_0175777670 /NCGR_PEP_ID=MMETSP0097-20121207/75280_1 /TAXON_ID=311494 /ORGANISM="Alexandrium monilatum, Strain CCMP3105" /LENGTH=54 /DNA_ID=CAMNT_0017088253 /DNA_START=34 /DNA_END=194 /DNA_ORIENTATION=-
MSMDRTRSARPAYEEEDASHKSQAVVSVDDLYVARYRLFYSAFFRHSDNSVDQV